MPGPRAIGARRRAMFLLSLVLAARVVAVTGDLGYLSDPDAFFAESSPKLVHDGVSFRLQLTTPLPVLCTVHHGPGLLGDVSDVNDISSMDMSSPAEVHDVVLPLDNRGQPYTILFTAFLSGEFHRVLRSSLYSAVASSESPSLALVDSADGASAPSMTGGGMVTCPSELTVEAEANSAALGLIPNPTKPTVHAIAYARGGGAIMDGMEEVYLARSGLPGLQDAPDLVLNGLEAGMDYEAEVCLVDANAELCCTARVGFETEQDESDGEGSSDCFGDNVALVASGATVTSASSIWGGGTPSSSFGSNKAIDGTPATQWSTAGDGDEAFLAVRLPQPVEIAGVGVWSRSMSDGSAIIKSFSLSLSTSDVGDTNAVEVGPFELESASEMYHFDIRGDLVGQASTTKFDSIQFNAVTTTGGNTGLRSFEVMKSSCVDEGIPKEPTEVTVSDAPTLAPVVVGDPPSTVSSDPNNDADPAEIKSSAAAYPVPVSIFFLTLVALVPLFR